MLLDLIEIRHFLLVLRHSSIHNLRTFRLSFISDELGSVVGIEIRYGLDGPGIESRWGRDFPHLSRPALGPTQTPVQWVPGLSRGVKAAGA